MELRDYLKVMRSRAGLVIVTVALVVAAALAYSYTQKPTFRASAEIIVLEQQNSGSILLGSAYDQLPSQPDQAYVLTQAQVIHSPARAGEVIRSLGLNFTAASLLQRVTATTDGESNIVTIDVLDSSAVRAADIANAFALSYIAWSRDNQIASIKAAGDELERRLTQTDEKIAELRRTGTSDPTALPTAEALRASLATKLEQLRINQQLATGSANVLANAIVDPAPASPNHARDAGLGLALGLLASFGAVFLAEQLNTKVRTAEDAETIYGVPVLANIPTETFNTQEPSRLTLVQHPAGAAADAYRGLCVGLDATFRPDVKTLLVTSAVPSEGKSTVAANLAVALSRFGRTVVLLSCDFYRPTTANFFDLPGTVGLSDVLTGTHGIDEALQRPEGFDRLSVVTTGLKPSNPGELLGSAGMEALVAGLRESVDWLILDVPPVLAVADAAAVARLVDGVLLVARVGVSTHDDCHAARDQLENVGARLLGVAVWGHRGDSAAVRVYSGYTSG